MKYSARHYATRLRMTNRPTLIVEGESDKFVIQKLLEALSPSGLDLGWLTVDSIDLIEDKIFSGLGNREKIEQFEHYATEMYGPNLKSLFALVDREFRDLPSNSTHAKIVENHVVMRRLYWTWGHSIENYFFSQRVFEELISTILFGKERASALELVSRSFSGWIHSAILLSKLGGRRLTWSLMEGSIGPECFEMKSGEAVFSLELWAKSLRRKNCLESDVNTTLDRAFQLNENPQNTSPNCPTLETIHGHTGLRLLNSGIDFILKTNFPHNWRVKSFLSENQVGRFDRICNAWSKLAATESLNHPRVLVTDMGLNTS